MMRSRSFQLIHSYDEKEQILQIEPRFPGLRGSFGADINVLAKDREIVTSPEETKRRRAIRLQRNFDKTWGFTLQTYGIRNKKTGEVDIMTYVDYVELNGPAWRAGMQQGDIILSVNGESVENVSHHDLVSKIKRSGFELRLVVLFENCCTKVDLHERYIKLKKLLQVKMKELHQLEEEEKKLTRGSNFFLRKDSLRQSITSSLCSDWDTYSEMIFLPQNRIHNKVKFDFFTSESSSASFHSDDTSNKNYSNQAQANLKESSSTYGSIRDDYTSTESSSTVSADQSNTTTESSPTLPADQSSSSEDGQVNRAFENPLYAHESILKDKSVSNNSSSSVHSLDNRCDITYGHQADKDSKENLLALKKFEDGILVNDTTLSSRL